jgi:hypothetical protein
MEVVLILYTIAVIVGIAGLVYIMKSFKKDNTPNQTPSSPNNEIPAQSTERQKETNHTNVTQPSASTVEPELRPESGLSDREYREALRRGYLTQLESLVEEKSESRYSDAQYREVLRKMHKREK